MKEIRALHRYPDWVQRRHGIVLAACLLLASGAAFLAAGLPVRTEVYRLLPADQPSVIAYRELSARRPESAVIAVAIASPSAEANRRFAGALAEAIRTRVRRDLVGAVDEGDGDLRRFVWEHRAMYVSQADLEAAVAALRGLLKEQMLLAIPFAVASDETGAGDGQVRPGFDDTLRSLRRRLEEARAAASGDPGWVAEEGRLRVIVLRCAFGDLEPDLTTATIRAVEAVITSLDPASYHPELTTALVGDPVTGALEHNLVLRDAARSTLLCLTLVAAVLLLFLRSVRAVLALCLTLVVGCALTFGFTRLVVGQLNTCTAFLASVVAGNGINFGIVPLTRYLEERRSGAAHGPALRISLERTAGPTLAAFAAASTAYLTLALTSFRGFSEFGIIASAGMAFCWAASMLLLPALLTVLDRFGPFGGARGPSTLLPLVERLIGRRRRTALVGALAIAAAAACSVVGLVRLAREPFEDDVRTLRSRSIPNSSAGMWLRRVEAAFGRGQSGGFYLALGRAEDAEPVVGAIRRADAAHGGAPLIGAIDALPLLLPGSVDQQRARSPLLDELRGLIDAVLPALESGSDRTRLLVELRPPDGAQAPIEARDLPPRVRRLFTEADGRVGAIVVAHSSTAIDPWSQRSVRRALGLLRSLQLPEGLGASVRLTGSDAMFTDISGFVEREGPRVSVLAFLLAFGLVLISLGRGRAAAATMLALSLGVCGMLGLMGTLGVRLNFINFIAVPITIGIAVDYPVNIAARLASEARAGRDPLRPLLETGAAVILCSLTTMIGYGVLMLSDTGAIRLFGAAAVLGEIACVSAALGVVPLVMRGAWSGRRDRGAVRSTDA